MRKQTSVLGSAKSSPIITTEQEIDYLDIPAFLRRQEGD
jgi:hypothetical protein